MSKELKNNIRSFRYSDRVAEILEGMEGKTLNEKFENLVITCHATLPDIQHKIEVESRCLERMRDDWWKLLRLKGDIEKRLGSIDSVSAEIEGLISGFMGRCNTDFRP